MNSTPRTLYDKIWQAHEVCRLPDGRSLLYIDRQLVHEVTSPQAFSGLEASRRGVYRPQSILAVPEHNVPTTERERPLQDKVAELQVQALERNCRHHRLNLIPLTDIRQGIVHIIGPELGFSQPGLTFVCGDSHTSTHGALGALAFGIGTSEIEHVLATQCLKLKQAKNMRISVEGRLCRGVYAKDLILSIIGRVGVNGGTGHCVEYAGDTITAMAMEHRMTVCNMSIEMGARAGMVAVDSCTEEYLKDRPFAPQGREWDQARAYWRRLHSDPGAVFDTTYEIDATRIEPQVTWGTTPAMTTSVGGVVPLPSEATDADGARSVQRALDYMGLKPGVSIEDICPEYIFIGSCTNARLSDLRAAADVVKGKKVSDKVKLAMVVPGSGRVRRQAEEEGLDHYFIEAGFEWRQPGCSMCLGMNPDRLSEGQRCASTSNRNFEGRQGRGGRTHLVSPATAAAAAVHGHFVDIREYL